MSSLTHTHTMKRNSNNRLQSKVRSLLFTTKPRYKNMKMVIASLFMIASTFQKTNIFAHAEGLCDAQRTQEECQLFLCVWDDTTKTCSFDDGDNSYEATDGGDMPPAPAFNSANSNTNDEGSHWYGKELDRSDPRDDQKDGEMTVLVKYKNERGRDFARHHSRGETFDLDIPEFHIARMKVNAQDLRDMYQDEDIEFFEEEGTYEAFEKSVSPKDQVNFLRRNLQGEQKPYGISQTQADQMWSLGQGAKKMKICVVDTGYSLGHVDLPTTATGWHDGSHGRWDIDGNGHGTHCAGSIGAIGGNGRGVVGVNSDPTAFQFIIGKGLNDNGSGDWGNVINAMLSCTNMGADIISMSLGGNGYSQSFYSATKAVYDKGVLIVAAAGNSGGSDSLYPAAYSPVMSVGAVDRYQNIASFSTHNAQVEISGPGVDILSTWPGNRYQTLSGTSMACPHVAGIAALVWSHFPSCTNTQIRNTLVRTSKDRGAQGCDRYYGYGIVQARTAYNMLKQYGCAYGGPTSNPLSNGAIGGCSQDPGFTPPPPPPPPPPTNSPTRHVCPNTEEKKFEIQLKLDNWPGDILWQIATASDPQTLLVNKGGYTEGNALVIDYECFKANELYVFTIFDAYGDGLCCNYGTGGYTIYFGGTKIGSGIAVSETKSESFEFGDGTPVTAAPVTPVPPTPEPITPAPTTPAPATPAPTTPMPTTPLPTTSAPTVNPTTSSPTPFECPDGQVELRMELTTDRWPGDITWNVVKHSTGVEVMKGDGEGQKSTLLIKRTCVEMDTLYDFNIYDSYGDGLCCKYGEGKFELYYGDGTIVASGDKFGSGASESFGIWTPSPTSVSGTTLEPTDKVCEDKGEPCFSRNVCCSKKCRRNRCK